MELEIHDADGVADRLTEVCSAVPRCWPPHSCCRADRSEDRAVSAPGALALAVGVLTWRATRPGSLRLPEPHEPGSAAHPSSPPVKGSTDDRLSNK